MTAPALCYPCERGDCPGCTLDTRDDRVCTCDHADSPCPYCGERWGDCYIRPCPGLARALIDYETAPVITDLRGVL